MHVLGVLRGRSARGIMCLEREKEMKAKTLIDIYQKLKERHIKIWLDGGWGVDALMGGQTRPHGDLDLVVEKKNLEKLVQILRNLGYAEMPRNDTRAWNFVFCDKKGNEIDIHVITININGDGIYGPPENEEAYPAQSLTGTGSINGIEVRCLTPEYQVHNHTGYKLKEKDYKDVKGLCDKYNLMPPTTFEKSLRGYLEKK